MPQRPAVSQMPGVHRITTPKGCEVTLCGGGHLQGFTVKLPRRYAVSWMQGVHRITAPQGCEVTGEHCKAAKLDGACLAQGSVAVAC